MLSGVRSAPAPRDRPGLPAKTVEVDPTAGVEGDSLLFEQVALEALPGPRDGLAAGADLALRVDHPLPGDFVAFRQPLERGPDLPGMAGQAGEEGDLAVGRDPAAGDAADDVENLSDRDGGGQAPGRGPGGAHRRRSLRPVPRSCARNRAMCSIAVVQMTSTSDAEANWRSARELVGRAAAAGARFVATPENTNYLGPHAEKVRRAEPLDGPTAGRFADLAREHGIHLLLGSFNERSDEAERCYNTSVLFGPDGAILATYRKIHLFDVAVPGGVTFSESATCKPGTEPVVVATPFGTLGLSICYDLRFGELYRTLAERGAEVLLVPSAFTLGTGKDHWEPLLRARAIETQTYVLAPAQVGRHDDQGLGESWGHAMIVDP